MKVDFPIKNINNNQTLFVRNENLNFVHDNGATIIPLSSIKKIILSRTETDKERGQATMKVFVISESIDNISFMGSDSDLISLLQID